MALTGCSRKSLVRRRAIDWNLVPVILRNRERAQRANLPFVVRLPATRGNVKSAWDAIRPKVKFGRFASDLPALEKRF
jgi:hypothetical protein